MVSTWTVTPWAVGIDTAKGLGGLSLHSSFPAWGPLPKSSWLNRQVVQLAIMLASPRQERTDAAKQTSAENPAAYFFSKIDAPFAPVPDIEGAHHSTSISVKEYALYFLSPRRP